MGSRAQPLFELGWFIPIAVLVCLALMGAMLTILRNLREWLTSADEPEPAPEATPAPPSQEAPVECGGSEQESGDRKMADKNT